MRREVLGFTYNHEQRLLHCLFVEAILRYTQAQAGFALFQDSRSSFSVVSGVQRFSNILCGNVLYRLNFSAPNLLISPPQTNTAIFVEELICYI